MSPFEIDYVLGIEWAFLPNVTCSFPLVVKLLSSLFLFFLSFQLLRLDVFTSLLPTPLTELLLFLCMVQYNL